jgi:hypothetical protein
MPNQGDDMTIQQEIERETQEALERMSEAIVYVLQSVGEECVNHARNLPSLSRDDPAAAFPHQPNWIDDTGNLRSSIGYIIVDNGQIVTESSFEAVRNGQEGSEKGKSFAESLVSEHTSDIALIVVAGMEYAEYVAAKGYDVLDSAELLAEQLVKEEIEGLLQ